MVGGTTIVGVSFGFLDQYGPIFGLDEMHKLLYIKPLPGQMVRDHVVFVTSSARFRSRELMAFDGIFWLLGGRELRIQWYPYSLLKALQNGQRFGATKRGATKW